MIQKQIFLGSFLKKNSSKSKYIHAMIDVPKQRQLYNNI